MQSDRKVQTDATICAAQEQALRTSCTKNKIEKTSENSLYRVCGEEEGEKLRSIKYVNVKM